MREAAGSLEATFALRIAGGLYLLSDYLVHPDAVMGGGETTAMLYRAAKPRTQVESALDLGCGAGTLALLLAAQAERVLGTDISLRAVELSRVNAAMNGISNTEFCAGNGWEPVAGEQFDLIVCQPPYYPGSGRTFLHGGPRGDELARSLVANLARHLKPAGRAVFFTSWPNDTATPHPAGLDLVELYCLSGEIPGTRQSLTAFQPGSGGALRREIPALSWGLVEARHIDAAFSALASDEQMLAACVRATEGLRFGEDGGDLFASGPPESLIGWMPVRRELREAVMRASAAPSVGQSGADPALVRLALELGLLVGDMMWP